MDSAQHSFVTINRPLSQVQDHQTHLFFVLIFCHAIKFEGFYFHV
jgi:hypothetical protein